MSCQNESDASATRYRNHFGPNLAVFARDLVASQNVSNVSKTGVKTAICRLCCCRVLLTYSLFLPVFHSRTTACYIRVLLGWRIHIGRQRVDICRRSVKVTRAVLHFKCKTHRFNVEFIIFNGRIFTWRLQSSFL